MMSKAVHTHIAMLHFKMVNPPPIHMTYQAMAMECGNQQIASNWAFLDTSSKENAEHPEVALGEQGWVDIHGEGAHSEQRISLPDTDFSGLFETFKLLSPNIFHKDTSVSIRSKGSLDKCFSLISGFLRKMCKHSLLTSKRIVCPKRLIESFKSVWWPKSFWPAGWTISACPWGS